MYKEICVSCDWHEDKVLGSKLLNKLEGHNVKKGLSLINILGQKKFQKDSTDLWNRKRPRENQNVCKFQELFNM